jgi:hypothetical protein
MAAGARQGSRKGLAEAQDAIQTFLESAKAPALLEPGEKPFPIIEGNYEIVWDGVRLRLQVWDRERNWSRRISALLEVKPGLVTLEAERFGGKTSKLQLVDQERPQSRTATQKHDRQWFRESLRRLLSKQYPRWEIAELSSEPDLQRTLSPAYPRALLVLGTERWAVIGAPPESDVDGALAFGLIWLDYLRTRDREPVKGLQIWLPEGSERNTLLRLRWLNPMVAHFAVHLYSEEGFARTADPEDVGNRDTRLPVRPEQSFFDLQLSGVEKLEGVDVVEQGEARVVRLRGLELARAKADGLMLTFDGARRRCSASELDSLARELAKRRNASADRQHPLYLRSPEAWLEAELRRSLQALDGSLESKPVYGQVPAFSAGDRGVMDLLAVNFQKRLAVIEIKASEDLQLPLQALDYWMRVKWHLDHGEFESKGFFPGLALSREAPKLYLVAPSLEWHPTTETILRYFSPQIDVERIGLAMDWRSRIDVAFRMGR